MYSSVSTYKQCLSQPFVYGRIYYLKFDNTLYLFEINLVFNTSTKIMKYQCLFCSQISQISTLSQIWQVLKRSIYWNLQIKGLQNRFEFNFRIVIVTLYCEILGASIYFYTVTFNLSTQMASFNDFLWIRKAMKTIYKGTSDPNTRCSHQY